MSIHNLWIGGISGLVATIPMSAVMKTWQQLLPVSEQYALPPKLITQELAEQAGVASDLDREELQAATLFNHFAHGAAAAAVYGALARGAHANVTTGVAFGGGVWAVSYLGWLPLLGMRAAATREPAGRNAMMLAAHLVFGGMLGATVARMQGD